METTKLKRFAQFARRSLIEQISEQLTRVLAADSAARREEPEAVAKLEAQIKADSEEAVIEAAAYVWFNRFCALRFMDMNRYTRVGVVSPLPGQFQPEILANAKQGDIDTDIVERESTRTKIAGLLSGKEPSSDPQAEAYRLLVVAACNYWHTAMPFLFEKIQDYTELLMPEDLLSGKSILSYTREALTPAACEDVEAIGWLYQFYISEKKDLVFEGLKKNKKITPDNIPAATQLFTPHWIVRYLVENSLGRLWMLNRPDSRLFKDMQEAGEDCYYIDPSEPETDFLKISSPEEIKICDPACGSGHMLTYAFDLLYLIYQEAGYDEAEIPEKILTHNLYGVEIDERAGELAAFALTMKAASKLKSSKQRRFFRKAITPNICVLENVIFEPGELKEYMDHVGRDLFTAPLQTTLAQFEEADNFGSLIRPELTDVAGIRGILQSQDFSSDWIYKAAHVKTLKALEQADYLSSKYHVVVANPPYMGIGNMGKRLKEFALTYYESSKNDFYSMFIERSLDLVKSDGLVGMITMQSWMYLSRFSSFRSATLNSMSIISFLHLGRRAFDSISGEVVQTVAFTLKQSLAPRNSTFVDLTSVDGEANKSALFQTKQNRKVINTDIFKNIPSWPLTYKMSPASFELFKRNTPLDKSVTSSSANVTGNNERFLRFNWEVSAQDLTFHSPYKWIPCAKGGEKRKWYGNFEYLIEWSPEAHTYYQNTKVCRYVQEEYWSKEGLTWSRIASAENISFRLLPKFATFETAGMTLFPLRPKDLFIAIGFLNTQVAGQILKWLNPTLTLQMCDVLSVPFFPSILKENDKIVRENVEKLIQLAEEDWNSLETSWGFSTLGLLHPATLTKSLQQTYRNSRNKSKEDIASSQRLEENNNRIFIDAYGLQGELEQDVPLKEITLTCNPHNRYPKASSDEERDKELLADTMREFISYAVGCMFGRYALEKPGLILANQGETFADYLKQIPEPSFPADDDNVIPMLDGEWFSDDISERFKTFLKVTFGTEHYDENLAFIENALGKKGKPLKIRDYFLKEFYANHWKRYQKRPIYWLFSSPKGSFNALIYMHRYRPETVGIVLNDYLREFRTKLTARLDHEQTLAADASASKTDKTKALKAIDKLKKQLTELEDWEREVLFPLASEKIEIDLDDGVKHNYPLFGKALKKVTGLSK